MTGKSTIWCSATSLKWMAGHSMLVSYVLEYVCRAGMDAIPEHWESEERCSATTRGMRMGYLQHIYAGCTSVSCQWQQG